MPSPKSLHLQQVLEEFMLEVPFDRFSVPKWVEELSHTKLPGIEVLESHVKEGWGLNCHGMVFLLRDRLKKLGLAEDQIKIIGFSKDGNADKPRTGHTGLICHHEGSDFLMEPSLLIPKVIELPEIGHQKSIAFPFSEDQEGEIENRTCRIHRLSESNLKLELTLLMGVMEIEYDLSHPLSDVEVYQKILNSLDKIHLFILARSRIASTIIDSNTGEVSHTLLTNCLAISRRKNYRDKDYEKLANFCRENDFDADQVRGFLMSHAN